MTTPSTFSWAPGQLSAITSIEAFLKPASPDRFFILKGYAGTGKSTLVQHIAKTLRGRAVFTAPTNKAVRVLKTILTTPDFRPECKTIYSLLGLRLEPNGAVRELAVPDEPVDLSKFRVVFVDEASMVNAALIDFIKTAAETFDLKCIFIGDPAQLPPVGEKASKVWDFPAGAELTEVMRNGGSILDFCTMVRDKQSLPFPKILLPAANDGVSGVWKFSPQTFEDAITKAAEAQLFLDPNVRAVAWRNATVDALNTLIRQKLFGEMAKVFFVPEDRVIMTAPMKDGDGRPILSTDDEGKVEKVRTCPHPTYPEWETTALTICFDHGPVHTIYPVSRQAQAAWDARCRELAEEAKTNPRRWKNYWNFREAFPQVRHAYALTAHRSQGSTYQTAFVDATDIMRNPTKLEALQCLYVAASRPKQKLLLR